MGYAPPDLYQQLLINIVMKPIQIISQDVFDKIRSRFQNLEMGDETGAVTIDPTQARFFDFDFVSEGNDLGRVSISLNDLGSLKIYYSQGITENQDDPAKKLWYSFLKEMRFFAMRRLLRFDTRDIAKTNLDRNDFQYLASKGTEDEEMMKQMNESRWNQKSSRKTSRAVKGTTEVIVRHHQNVDEMYPGARSQRKNIKAIFIQNREGERYKYPFIHPAGAFAMAQHVDHGGVPHDPAGKAIMRMSEQIAQLQEFSRQVQHSQLHDDAMGIADRAQGRLRELKGMIEALGKRNYYESWISEFDDAGMDDGLEDLDPVTMENYKTKFTQTNFKEELAQYFPLIHKIMQETNAIDLEDYVGEGEECAKCHQDPCECDDDKIGEGIDDFAQFEAWAEAVEKGELSPKQIADLKQALTNLQVPLDLGTAYNFFNQFGIDDEALEKAFRDEALRSEELRAEPIEVFKSWATDNYGELLLALGMSGTEAPAPAEEPAPEVGAQPEEPVAAENDEMQMNPGTMEGQSKESMIKEVAKIVKQFYNEDTPEVGPFRGEEGILLDVEKQISEKFGEQAGHQAREVAGAFMEKLTKQWEERHGKSSKVGAVDSDDGLARLKELLGNIKQKVEGIGDQGQGGRDFNTNIMSAEQDAAEGSGANKTHLAMAYLMTVVMAPTGTPENERIRNWQEKLEDEFDIEMDTATLAQMLPQFDSQLKSGQLDKLQNRMASRGELEIGETQQGMAESKEHLARIRKLAGLAK